MLHMKKDEMDNVVLATEIQLKLSQTIGQQYSHRRPKYIHMFKIWARLSFICLHPNVYIETWLPMKLSFTFQFIKAFPIWLVVDNHK